MTSFVVLSLRVAVTVSCEVSPTVASVRLPLIERPVTVGDGTDGDVGVVGLGVDLSPPQLVHEGARRIRRTTASLLRE